MNLRRTKRIRLRILTNRIRLRYELTTRSHLRIKTITTLTTTSLERTRLLHHGVRRARITRVELVQSVRVIRVDPCLVISHARCPP
jgi:hypothetical protein